MNCHRFRAAVMVFGALLTVGCGEGMPSFGGAAPAETPPPAVEVAAPVVPLLGPQVVLNVDCAALSASPGFVREITLTGGDGVYSFTNGEPGKHRYEHWEMQVDAAGVFQVSGEYIEGTPDVKQVSFEGAVKAGVVEGQGKRGPRPCTLRSEQ